MEPRNESLIDQKLKQTYKILGKAGKLLTFSYITDKLIEKKLLNDSPFEKSRLWTRLTDRCEIFTTISSFERAAVGLKEWIPLKKRPKRKRPFFEFATALVRSEMPKIGGKKNKTVFIFKHKLNREEIEESYLVLPRELLNLFNYSGIGFQLTIYCYGDYSFNAWVNSEFSTLHSPEIGNYYQENKLKIGDFIFFEKRRDDPTGIHLFTLWQIEEHELGESGLKKRSKQISDDLKSKGLLVDDKTNEDDNYDPVYLLSLIQKKDLVYKFLKYNGPSNANDIANAISKELGIKKEKIEKLSFIDFSDKRILRLPNGKIGIREAETAKVEIKHKKNLLVERKKIVVFVIILAITTLLVMAGAFLLIH